MTVSEKDCSRPTYSERVWLNPADSPSTGSLVAYDGPANWGDEGQRATFLEVADCNWKVRLHLAKGDTAKDFATKMRAFSEAAAKFADHLDPRKEEEPAPEEPVDGTVFSCFSCGNFNHESTGPGANGCTLSSVTARNDCFYGNRQHWTPK